MVAGIPDAVSNVSYHIINDTLFANWEAPFVFNVRRTNPDITFCVNVINITTDDQSVYAECNINITSHKYYINLLIDTCHTFRLDVVASNVLGNSSAQSVQISEKSKEYICTYLYPQ